MNRPPSLLLGAVAVHVVLSALHGLVHASVPVHVHGWQYGYAVVVVALAPLVGTALLARGRTVAGGWLLVTSGLAAFAFEGLYHFVVPNPDHVATVAAVGAGGTVFTATAALTTAGDAVLVVAAVRFLRRSADGRAVGPVDRTTPD